VRTTKKDHTHNVKLTDQQLIESVIAGEPGASDLMVDRWSNFIWSILKRNLSMPTADTEDLHSTVFLRLLEDGCRRLRNWSGEGNFVNYLGPIVRNLANDYFRKKKTQNEIPIDAEDDEDAPSPVILISSDPGPDDVAATAERHRLLHQAIKDLSDRDRQLIQLRHFEELSYQQIADAMDYKISSVGVILARAEKRLKKAVVRRTEECRLASVEL